MSSCLPSEKTRHSLLYLASFIVEGLNISSFGPLIPIKAKLSNQPETNYSIVFTLMGLGFIIGCALVNYLEKRLGAHKAIGIAFFIISVMCYLVGSQTNVFWIAIYSFIIGINDNILTVLGQVQIMAIHTGTALNSWIQALHFGFGVGAALSPIIISFLGMNASYLYGSFALILGIFIFREKDSDPTTI